MLDIRRPFRAAMYSFTGPRDALTGEAAFLAAVFVSLALVAVVWGLMLFG